MSSVPSFESMDTLSCALGGVPAFPFFLQDFLFLLLQLTTLTLCAVSPLEIVAMALVSLAFTASALRMVRLLKLASRLLIAPAALAQRVLAPISGEGGGREKSADFSLLRLKNCKFLLGVTIETDWCLVC